MASIDVKASDGKTLTVQIPAGTDPSNYGSLADEAAKHYADATSQSGLPVYASPEQQKQYPISSMISKGLGVGLEGLNAPFQAFGEPIRQAVTAAQGQNPGPYRAPTVIQRMLGTLLPKINTKEQAPDMFSAAVNPAYAGLKGLTATAMNMTPDAAKGALESLRTGTPQPSADLGKALQSGTQAVQSPPGIPEAALTLGAAAGSGELGNVPFTAAMEPFKALANLIETGEVAGIPGIGMIGKAASGADAVPLGMENLTAHADPELLSFKNSDNPDIKKAADLLTPGGLTGSPTQSAIEGFLSKLPFSSNVMNKRFNTFLEALGKVREPAVEASKPAVDLGLDVQQGIANKSNEAYANSQGLFNKAGSFAPEGTQIPLSNVQNTASNLYKRQTKLGAAKVGDAQALLKELAGSGYEGQIQGQSGVPPVDAANAFLKERGLPPQTPVPPPQMDYQTIQDLRSELNSRIAKADAALKSPTPGAKFQSSPEAGLYKQLKTSLNKDLQAYSDKTGGQFQSAYSDATKTYQTYKQSYRDDKFFQSIMGEQNPENVVNKIVKAAKDNPRALGMLKLNLPPETLNDLQTYFIKDMTEKDPNIFNPSHFVSQWNAIGEKRLTEILGEKKLAQLRPLYALSKASKTAEKFGASATGPSGAGVGSAIGMTAPLMMTLREMAHGKPIQGIIEGLSILGAEMEGLPTLANGYLSEPASKVLTRQISATPSFPNAAKAASTVGKLSQPVNALSQNPQIQQTLMQLLQRLRQNKQSQPASR